jgi:hypothetical protein
LAQVKFAIDHFAFPVFPNLDHVFHLYAHPCPRRP